MTAKQIIGTFMLLIPALTIIIGMGISYGWIETFITCGVAAAMVALIVCGTHFLAG